MRRRCQEEGRSGHGSQLAGFLPRLMVGYLADPRILWKMVFCGGQVQRCSGGTPASACSTCLPHPPHVALPHREHFTRWHMAENSARKGPIPARGVQSAASGRAGEGHEASVAASALPFCGVAGLSRARWVGGDIRTLESPATRHDGHSRSIRKNRE